jgi:hypothetical protein
MSGSPTVGATQNCTAGQYSQLGTAKKKGRCVREGVMMMIMMMKTLMMMMTLMVVMIMIMMLMMMMMMIEDRACMLVNVLSFI